MGEVFVTGQIKDLAGTTTVNVDSSTEPNAAYCFVYENPNLEFNVAIGIIPPTFKEFIEQSYYIPKVITELRNKGMLEHVKLNGFKFMCDNYVTIPVGIGVWYVAMSNFRMECFVKDKGDVAPLVIIAACIGVGILIVAVASSFLIVKFSPEEAADLLNDLADKGNDAIVKIALIAFGFLALVLIFSGGTVGVNRSGASVKTGGGLPSLGKGRGK